VGKNTKESSSCFPVGAEQTLNSIQNNARNQFIKDVPIGIGAQSGNSSNNGKGGASEAIVTQTTLSKSVSGGSSGDCIFDGTYSAYNYDFSFGGAVISCYRLCYDPGVFSTDYGLKLRGGGQSVCDYVTYDYFFYMGYSACINSSPCHKLPYGLAASTLPTGACLNRTYNLGFVNDENVSADVGDYQINLSTLTNENGLNINDISYGRGAGITTSASYGGGGNRLYPTPGNGLVVVIY